MFRYLTKLFGPKSPLKQRQKDSVFQVKQPVCYMLITESARMKPLDINCYLTGGHDAHLQTTYQRDPRKFGVGIRDQYPADYKFYLTIEDLVRGEFGLKIGVGSHEKGSYILQFGFDKVTVLSLIESGQFHLAIIEAVNLSDLWRFYGPDKIFGHFDSTPLPIPTERVEILTNPDFSPTLPKDVSEKTAPSALCKC